MLGKILSLKYLCLLYILIKFSRWFPSAKWATGVIGARKTCFTHVSTFAFIPFIAIGGLLTKALRSGLHPNVIGSGRVPGWATQPHSIHLPSSGRSRNSNPFPLIISPVLSTRPMYRLLLIIFGLTPTNTQHPYKNNPAD